MLPPTWGPIPQDLWDKSQPLFGCVSQHLWDESPPLKDRTASGRLNMLDRYIGLPRGHAHGSWGYTILRTAYGPGSDALFAAALDRLKSYVHWWCHDARFFAYGALCERERVDFAEPNEELFRRFYIEVIEDREGLAHLDGGDGITGDARFMALGEYFRRWVAGVFTGMEPEHNPRFCTCLVLDSESVASVAALPEELPLLRCAVDREEKQKFMNTGEGAWVWLLETDYMAEPESHEDAYRGWMKMDLRDVEFSWFRRLGRGISRKRDHFEHEEREPGSGIYWFDE